jgi:anthranilate synthase component 1
LLGADPRLIVRSKGSRAEIIQNGQTESTSDIGDPTRLIKSIMERFRGVTVPGLPDFYGGAVGFLAYDVVRDFERLPDFERSDPGFYDAWFMITRDMVIFDNLSHKILLITTVAPDEVASLKSGYIDARLRLEALRERMARPASHLLAEVPSDQEVVLSPNMEPSRFGEMVLRAKEYIRAGDIIQVVLSQRFEGSASTEPLNVYRGLRMINPSPYMFFLRMGDEVLAGSSPEVMVRLRNGEAVVRPIAGTRPRGVDRSEDQRMEKELLADAKELAEHVMLVDLARNDLGRIAAPGTVNVDAFKTIERYSHVMHMVSNVRAKPANGCDAFDVLRACFPAGTLSGAPKIRAMEIIEELEPDRRGPYGGCVGYFSFTGAMDMGITIRTVMMKGSKAYVQAGAGIVADSVPEFEYQETMRKAEAMRRALNAAHEFQGRTK